MYNIAEMLSAAMEDLSDQMIDLDSKLENLSDATEELQEKIDEVVDLIQEEMNQFPAISEIVACSPPKGLRL